MDHATTTDLAALEAEIAALEAQHAATDARVDALLNSWEHRPTTGQRMAALWEGVEQLRRWNDQDEADLDALRVEIEAMEQDT
jgi:hypothetical protein